MTGQENHVLLSLSTLDKVSHKVSTLLCVQYLQYGTSYFDHVAAGSLEMTQQTLDRRRCAVDPRPVLSSLGVYEEENSCDLTSDDDCLWRHCG